MIQSTESATADAYLAAPLCDISLVIPLYNEAESLSELVSQIYDALEKSDLENYFGHVPAIEILFVNDGSNDGSDAVIKKLLLEHHDVKLISFRRNYGKSAALDAGFAAASGKYVITMDADLQDSPYEIEPLIRKLEEGFDLVSGWKKKRYDPISKTLPSRLFNAVTSIMSGVALHDFNCGLKAYRHDVVKTVQVYGEMHRYIPVLAKWNGFRIGELVVQHRPRKYGITKFGISRFFNGFLDLLTIMFIMKYLKRPMHFFGVLGIFSFLSGFGLAGYLSFEKLVNDQALSNRPALFLAVMLIILGVQLFGIGLLGEMVAKTGHSTEPYLIKEKINFGSRN